MKRYPFFIMICLVSSGWAIFPCVGESSAVEAKGEGNKRLVSAITRFGFKLFQEILKEDAGKNIFVSPSSAAIALAMTYNGAEGETKEAMAKTLELEGMSLEEVNQAHAVLKRVLKSPDPKVELTIANSLWMRRSISFKQQFIQRNKEFYKADVTPLDFNDPGAPSTINEWVNKETKGKIEKIVENIDPLTVLFLINAIYFKGKWTVEFDKKETKEGMFALLDGTQKRHPMMSQSRRYRYYQGEGFQAVNLPYGEKRVSMVIFLPDRGSNLDEFHKSLNAENWERWMSHFREMEGAIVMPLFKLEYEVNLNEPLKTLGMEVAFDSQRANFEGMIEKKMVGYQNVYISNVKQKTFVEVKEEGTEAAAVTSVEVTETSLEPTFNMTIDRPFFFAIRDNETGTVLFMGSIVDPKL